MNSRFSQVFFTTISGVSQTIYFVLFVAVLKVYVAMKTEILVVAVLGILTLVLGRNPGKRQKRKRQISALEDNTYELMRQMVEGEFDVPVKKRTALQKSTLVRYWRNKNRFSIDRNGNLLYDDTPVLKKSDLRSLVNTE